MLLRNMYHCIFRHVILGFSHKGDCIISYFQQSIFQEYKYWLCWWHFDINKNLTLVSPIYLTDMYTQNYIISTQLGGQYREILG